MPPPDVASCAYRAASKVQHNPSKGERGRERERKRETAEEKESEWLADRAACFKIPGGDKHNDPPPPFGTPATTEATAEMPAPFCCHCQSRLSNSRGSRKQEENARLGKQTLAGATEGSARFSGALCSGEGTSSAAAQASARSLVAGRNPLGRPSSSVVACGGEVGGWSKKYWHRLPIVVWVMEWIGWDAFRLSNTGVHCYCAGTQLIFVMLPIAKGKRSFFIFTLFDTACSGERVSQRRSGREVKICVSRCHPRRRFAFCPLSATAIPPSSSLLPFSLSLSSSESLDRPFVARTTPLHSLGTKTSRH